MQNNNKFVNPRGKKILDHLTSSGLAYSQILLARIYEPLVLVNIVISWIWLADLNPCTTCTMYISLTICCTMYISLTICCTMYISLTICCTMYISLTIFLFRSGIAFYFHLFSTAQVTVRPKKKSKKYRVGWH